MNTASIVNITFYLQIATYYINIVSFCNYIWHDLNDFREKQTPNSTDV